MSAGSDSSFVDHYTVLGVQPTDDTETIRKAYKKLALKYHPDKGGDHVKFLEIQKAVEILTDKTDRATFNARWYQRQQQQRRRAKPKAPFWSTPDGQARASGSSSRPRANTASSVNPGPSSSYTSSGATGGGAYGQGKSSGASSSYPRDEEYTSGAYMPRGKDDEYYSSYSKPRPGGEENRRPGAGESSSYSTSNTNTGSGPSSSRRPRDGTFFNTPPPNQYPGGERTRRCGNSGCPSHNGTISHTYQNTVRLIELHKLNLQNIKADFSSLSARYKANTYLRKGNHLDVYYDHVAQCLDFTLHFLDITAKMHMDKTSSVVWGYDCDDFDVLECLRRMMRDIQVWEALVRNAQQCDTKCRKAMRENKVMGNDPVAVEIREECMIGLEVEFATWPKYTWNVGFERYGYIYSCPNTYYGL